MFVVLGIVTVLIGVVMWFWLPGTLMEMRFLRETAKEVMLLRHVAVNRTGIRKRGFKARQVLEVMLDVQIWLMTLLTILVCVISFRNYLSANTHCDLGLQSEAA